MSVLQKLLNLTKPKQTNVFKDVETFMTACGQQVPRLPSNTNQLSDLYLKLIKEECGEFEQAIADNNSTEQLDACFDMIWVIVGYMKSRGWDCDAAWVEGAKSNLSKIDAKTGKVIRRSDGKILKPDGWQPPNFKKFV